MYTNTNYLLEASRDQLIRFINGLYGFGDNGCTEQSNTWAMESLASVGIYEATIPNHLSDEKLLAIAKWQDAQDSYNIAESLKKY